MSSSGFDWLSLPSAADRSVEHLSTPPPPPVSFGVSSHSIDTPSEITPSAHLQPSIIEQQHQSNHSQHQTTLQEHLHLQLQQQFIQHEQQLQSSQSQSNQKLPEIDFKNLFNDFGKSSSPINASKPVSSKTEKNQVDDTKSKEQEEEILKNFKDDSSIPLSLTVEQLTSEEAKTYLRWYNDIITRRGTRTITLTDVFKFMNNFKINDLHKKIIQKIFQSCSQSLNIGQFFCVLRIISHAIVSSVLPCRELIKSSSPIPSPVSILARKRVKEADDDNEDEEDSLPLSNGDDTISKLDSFAQFMLTGQRPDPSTSSTPGRRKKKHLKTVKFSDTVEIEPTNEELPPLPPPPPVVDDKIDFTLPMEQLLSKITPQHGVTTPPQLLENEEEELKDMQDAINHFRNVHIDSVSIDGVPANIPSNYFVHSPMRIASPQREDSSSPQLLQPNLTGSVSKSMRQGLGITSPPPPPPRMRSVSSPVVPGDDHLSVPAHQYQNISASPRVSSPLSNNSYETISSQWQPPSLITSPAPSLSPAPAPPPPPPPPPRSRSSTMPNHSASLSVPPPPPRSRKGSNAQSTQSQVPYTAHPGPKLPPKIEVNHNMSPPRLGFDDYFRNGAVYKSGSDSAVNQMGNIPMNNISNVRSSSSSDILGDLKALKLEVDKIKYMSGNGGY